MTAIVEQIRDLNLPADQFVVIGSGVLEAHGIRKAGDADLVLSQALWKKALESDAWSAETSADGIFRLKHEGDIEAFPKWWKWSFDELREDAEDIDGIWFVSLLKVREFKVWRGLDKDMADVQLIDEYLKEH